MTASTAMRWPPVYGGPIYWGVRHRLFQSRCTVRRWLRYIRANWDREYMKALAEPKRSYDNRCNVWAEEAKRKNSSLTSKVGVMVYFHAIVPLMAGLLFFRSMYRSWANETNPYQAYRKWSRIHRDQKAALAEMEEEEED